MKPLILRLWRASIVRFAIVGGTGFVVDIAVLKTCLFVGVREDFAQVPAIGVAMMATWIGNRSFTFAHRPAQMPLVAELAAYILANSVGAVINLCVYAALIDEVGGIWRQWPTLAVVAATLVSMGANYAGARYLIFRKPANDKA